jgi:hypothetical protein
LKTVIDNTALQLISKFNTQNVKSTAIYPIEVINNLFHFAEHILFADEMEVISFSNPTIRENTYSTTDFLNSTGCISPDQKGSLLNIIDYSADDYANACEDASSHIIDDLLGLNIDLLLKCGELSDVSTRPLGVDFTGFEKWITKEWSNEERQDFKYKAIEMKGDGICDYAICSNDALYHQFKLLTSNLDVSSDNLSKILYALNVFFRTAINQSLASQRNAQYSPAPQRSNVISKSDQLFRYAISKEITRVVSSIDGSRTSNFLKLLRNSESIPLPIFALHFLRKRKSHWQGKGPLAILDAARYMRDEKEVRELRNWLNKWENDYNSFDIEKKFNARKIWLTDFSKDLKIEIEPRKFSWRSLFRVGIDINPNNNSIKIDLDLPGKIEFVNSLLKRYSRRRIFFSMLKELSDDEYFGRDIIDQLNISILK